MAEKGGGAYDALYQTWRGVVRVTKWVRSAFWIGQPRSGTEDQFRAAMNGELIPGLRTLPGVRDANALWPQKREDSPPQIACQVLVEFDSREDLERMLASAERRALRPRVLEVVGLFAGSLSHIDYEVG
jgi:hypothetical protein